VTYDVEGPDPVPRRNLTKPLRTAIVLAVLAVAVLIAGRWGWAQLTQPFGDEVAAATATSEPTCTPAPGASPALPAPGEVTVNVYNASGISGLAGQTAEALAAAGFIVGAVDNDPLGKRLDGVGEVRSAPGSQPQVESLLRYIPGAVWVQDQRADPTVDFAIGAGFTEVTQPPPPAQGVPADDGDGIPTC
jgi:hypothetical protein